MNWITRLTAIFTLCLSSFSAMAQENGADVSIGALNIEGLTTGKSYIFDQGYTQYYDVEVPAPFEIVVPTVDGINNIAVPKPGGTAIAQFYFLTPDEQVRSNIQFVPMTVDMADTEQRLEWTMPLLQRFFQQQVPDGVRNAIDGARKITDGPYPAAELVGRYETEDDGVVIVRIVAILNPQGEDAIVAIILGSANVLGLKDVSGIYETLASQTLDSFRFK